MILILFEYLWIIFMGQVCVNTHNTDSVFWYTQEINNWSKCSRLSSIKTISEKTLNQIFSKSMKPVIEVKHWFCCQPIAIFYFSVSYCQPSFPLFNFKLCTAEQRQKAVFKADNSLLTETFLSPPIFHSDVPRRYQIILISHHCL